MDGGGLDFFLKQAFLLLTNIDPLTINRGYDEMGPPEPDYQVAALKVHIKLQSFQFLSHALF